LRNRKRAAGTFFALAVMVIACSGDDPAASSGISQGNRARDFTLEAVDGGQVSLSDYEGNVVLVNFWATWCSPCRDEIPSFEAAYRVYKDKGFVVLGINVEESRSAVEPFVAEMDVTFPMLLDEQGKVMNEYRALGLPMSLLVDREGVISVRHMGYLSDGQLKKYLDELLLSP
jgi:cytochrome c biogenesis protein CcmG/thiol:disulfide interchange protein DsbE